MDESDFGTFERALGRVSGAFQMRWKAGQLEELTRTYFRCFDRWPIDAVIEAGKVCIQTLRHFPKAAEWLEVLETRERQQQGDRPPAWRTMTDEELTTRLQADRLHYREPPCGCPDCVAAGVSDQPIRFVPTLVNGTDDRVYNPRQRALDVTGHWAHGDELARWYQAQAAFYQRARMSPRTRHLVLVGREPGEEG